MRRLLILFSLPVLLAACGGSSGTSKGGGPVQQTIQNLREGVFAQPGHRRRPVGSAGSGGTTTNDAGTTTSRGYGY